MLTQEQLDILKLPFTPQDVMFKQTYIYAQEDAIADRIEMVDPSWTFERLSMEYRDKVVTATFRLTICDVWRDGVGMERTDSATESEKSAATDALKRAARLFGIGRYFQTLPNGVKDWKSYEEWYKASVGNTTQKPATQPQQVQTTTEPPELVDNGVYRVNSFTMNMSKGRVQKPYMVFAIGNSAAFSYTREPFRVAGYNVDGWTKVTNYELPTAADITVGKNADGYFIVKSVKMIDLFADSKSA